MTKKKDILQNMADLLDEAVVERAREIGGYPDCVGVVGDHVIVATTDENNEPSFAAYDRATCEEWYDAYRQIRREHRQAKEYESKDVCLWESRPQHCG